MILSVIELSSQIELKVDSSDLVLIPSTCVSGKSSLRADEVSAKPFSTTESDVTAAFLNQSNEYTPVYLNSSAIKTLHSDKERLVDALPFFATQSGNSFWGLRQNFEEYLDLDFIVTIKDKNEHGVCTTLDLMLSYDRELLEIHCAVGLNEGDGADDYANIEFNENISDCETVADLDNCEFNDFVTKADFVKHIHENPEFNRVVKGVFDIVGASNANVLADGLKKEIKSELDCAINLVSSITAKLSKDDSICNSLISVSFPQQQSGCRPLMRYEVSENGHTACTSLVTYGDYRHSYVSLGFATAISAYESVKNLTRTFVQYFSDIDDIKQVNEFSQLVFGALIDRNYVQTSLEGSRVEKFTVLNAKHKTENDYVISTMDFDRLHFVEKSCEIEKLEVLCHAQAANDLNLILKILNPITLKMLLDNICNDKCDVFVADSARRAFKMVNSDLKSINEELRRLDGLSRETRDEGIE